MFDLDVKYSESFEQSGHMSRTYEQSHSWITFQLNTERFPASLYLLLGEARSKCEHLAGVPLQPETAHKLHQIYLAKGVLATTAIEGNTLSMDEVEKYLEGKLKLPPSKEYLKTEIENIVNACNMIVTHAVDGDGLPLTVDVINSFNKMILDRLEVDEEVVPGKLRQHDVGVARYRGAPWQDCPFLLDRLTEWLHELEAGLPEEFGSAKAIIMAILAHLYVAWIHPYGDGNGRTARLMEFAILVKAGLPIPAAHLLSDHYNETRTQYYRELDRASKSGGDVVPFVCYAVQGFVDGLRKQIDDVKAQQLSVAWKNYVFETLHEHTEAAKRRRHLVFALTQATEPVRLRDVMTLTPQLAQLYAHKTTRTVARDINALKRGHLVLGVRGGRVVANTTRMLAFLPARASRNP